jgi:hypothetical protein
MSLLLQLTAHPGLYNPKIDKTKDVELFANEYLYDENKILSFLFQRFIKLLGTMP